MPTASQGEPPRDYAARDHAGPHDDARREGFSSFTVGNRRRISGDGEALGTSRGGWSVRAKVS